MTNERKGEEVHVGPGGVHIDTLEDDGHSVRTNDDGTVTIDGETFSSWKEAHDKLDHHGKHFHTKAGRAWNKFPFPALVTLAYLVLGIVYGTWGMGLFLVFLIPVYYAIGDFIDRRHLSKLIEVIYPAAAIAWFLYMWLCLGQPHPAWIILITIPIIKALMRWCRKQWKHRKQAISPQLTNNWVSSGTEISIELTARQEKGLFTTFNSRGPTIPAFSENWQALYLRF